MDEFAKAMLSIPVVALCGWLAIKAVGRYLLG